jgi:hypothetical protein
MRDRTRGQEGTHTPPRERLSDYEPVGCSLAVVHSEKAGKALQMRPARFALLRSRSANVHGRFRGPAVHMDRVGETAPKTPDSRAKAQAAVHQLSMTPLRSSFDAAFRLPHARGTSAARPSRSRPSRL